VQGMGQRERSGVKKWSGVAHHLGRNWTGMGFGYALGRGGIEGVGMG